MTRPRGNKAKVAADRDCVIFPQATYRWPGAASAHTGFGTSKLRALQRKHQAPLLKVGEAKFIHGWALVAMIEAAAKQDGNGQD